MSDPVDDIPALFSPRFVAWAISHSLLALDTLEISGVRSEDVPHMGKASEMTG